MILWAEPLTNFPGLIREKRVLSYGSYWGNLGGVTCWLRPYWFAGIQPCIVLRFELAPKI